MFDPGKLRVSAIQDSGMWLELRPHRGEGLRIRFGSGADVTQIVLSGPDSELRAVANGESRTFQSGPKGVAFARSGDVLEVTFVGHLADGSQGRFQVRPSDFQMLVESAISARNDPSASLVVS